MYSTQAYAALSPTTPLVPYTFSRRALRDEDILIDIKYSGICHSDIHETRDEWGPGTYPMVPGHEIVGVVAAVGPKVTKFNVGDQAGVGVFVDTCRTCPSCLEGLEQYCENHVSLTYASTEQDKVTPTHGGYSTKIVVDQNYALHIPTSLSLAATAPLLCAGITTYSPLRHWKAGPGEKVAIVGLGGLGHMATKLAAALGAEVTVLSTSRRKEPDALRFGAKTLEVFTDSECHTRLNRSFDLIIDTVSAPHDLNLLAYFLRRDGTIVLVGLPPEALPIAPFSIVPKRCSLSGSMIGSIGETQEMLNFCGERGIVSDIELISADQINDAYERTIKGDVRYRFVIDAATF